MRNEAKKRIEEFFLSIKKNLQAEKYKLSLSSDRLSKQDYDRVMDVFEISDKDEILRDMKFFFKTAFLNKDNLLAKIKNNSLYVYLKEDNFKVLTVITTEKNYLKMRQVFKFPEQLKSQGYADYTDITIYQAI